MASLTRPKKVKKSKVTDGGKRYADNGVEFLTGVIQVGHGSH
jgi:hypothetical protein